MGGTSGRYVGLSASSQNGVLGGVLGWQGLLYTIAEELSATWPRRLVTRWLAAPSRVRGCDTVWAVPTGASIQGGAPAPAPQRDGWWEKVVHWAGEKRPIESIGNVDWNCHRGATQWGQFSSPMVSRLSV